MIERDSPAKAAMVESFRFSGARLRRAACLKLAIAAPDVVSGRADAVSYAAELCTWIESLGGQRDAETRMVAIRRAVSARPIATDTGRPMPEPASAVIERAERFFTFMTERDDG